MKNILLLGATGSIGDSVLKVVRQNKDSLNLYGIAAVSYTHLRAHETVLDLVCRLLLEKKKIQKKI